MSEPATGGETFKAVHRGEGHEVITSDAGGLWCSCGGMFLPDDVPADDEPSLEAGLPYLPRPRLRPPEADYEAEL